SEITYGQSQIAYYQSVIDKNPSASGSPRDHSLSFASKLLGLSVEQALKIYNERTNVGSDTPSAADLGATPVTEAERLAKQTSATTPVDFSV
ncbi:MAG: hypothetical protein Q7T73_15670, partial [Beijerinckiaceae bacterium]|nr:hypothetical protein [Beijerinckiaceae bacterium]